MSMPVICDVCAGMGQYPIINSKGRELYSITCPECFGSGAAKEDADPVEYPALPPPSSAARVRSMAEMNEHLAKHWALAPLPHNRLTNQEKT
jgi:hypothetical protein